MELGLELRYPTSRSWRHELHKWELSRRRSENPERLDVEVSGDPAYPPDIWYEAS
jgi:hypothetical protein